MVLTFDQSVVLVGDAPFDLTRFAEFKDLTVIAVDGGANACAKVGIKADVITGDFDSVAPQILTEYSDAQRRHLPDQNYGDLEKTLQIIDAPKIYALGFLGGRFDHSFEALRILSLYHERNLELLKDGETISIWRSGETRKMEIGQRISFVSLADCQVLSSEGLQYPPDGLTLGALKLGVRTTSLSNRVVQKDVRVTYEGAPLIAIVEN